MWADHLLEGFPERHRVAGEATAVICMGGGSDLYGMSGLLGSVLRGPVACSFQRCGQ